MQRMASGNKAPPAVLVVDDDPDLVDLLSRFLSRQGMKILVASNGPQCLEIVQSSPSIDVIVLDIMMPGMDGLQVCAALKEIESARTIPIILLTARDDVETRIAGVELGVSEFIIKPASGRDLVARIQTQVEASRKARIMEQTPNSSPALESTTKP
ncbi:MAG: PleD family two-component system response regulator [Candidatus Binatia bacterium]